MDKGTHTQFTFFMRDLLFIKMHCFTIVLNLYFLRLQAQLERNSAMFMEGVKKTNKYKEATHSFHQLI